jgi:hypothetical protein
MSGLKVSSLVDFPEKYFKEIKNILYELHQVTVSYASADALYDVEGLEKLKRGATAQLELLANHYARTKRFKTMGDYLEETRKQVKAETIKLIVANEGLSVNQAEKMVYADDYYKDRIALMETLKAFFIRVEIMYENYKNLLKSIIQSISLCKKDPNYKPVEN